MNLQENIHRIQSMMGVITEDKRDEFIKNMIDELGITSAIKMAGNYYEIEPYLTNVDKVNYIKDKVYELNDGRSVNLSVINGDTIHYGEEGGKLHQIEWLGKENVTVKTYGDNMNYIGTFYVNYNNLPTQIIEELVEMFINH